MARLREADHGRQNQSGIHRPRIAASERQELAGAPAVLSPDQHPRKTRQRPTDSVLIIRATDLLSGPAADAVLDALLPGPVLVGVGPSVRPRVIGRVGGL